MLSTTNDLQGVLDGYRNFLQERDFGPTTHQPYVVRWVREFLVFAETHRGYSFEQTLDLFLAEVGTRVGVKPWQLQQAASAVRIYRYQFRGARKREDAESLGPSWRDEASMLGRLREVIRLRHYAKSTEKTYLHWTRRFLAYRRGAGGADEPTSDDVRAFLTRLAMGDRPQLGG
jgi:hypothetical protein